MSDAATGLRLATYETGAQAGWKHYYLADDQQHTKLPYTGEETGYVDYMIYSVTVEAAAPTSEALAAANMTLEEYVANFGTKYVKIDIAETEVDGKENIAKIVVDPTALSGSNKIWTPAQASADIPELKTKTITVTVGANGASAAQVFYFAVYAEGEGTHTNNTAYIADIDVTASETQNNG